MNIQGRVGVDNNARRHPMVEWEDRAKDIVQSRVGPRGRYVPIEGTPGERFLLLPPWSATPVPTKPRIM